MSLKGCATATAISNEKRQMAYETGKKIVELIKKGIKPSDIMTENAFNNAIRVDMAMGGSTNAVLHIPAIAKELDIQIDPDLFDRISRETPNICSIIPSGPYEMKDIHMAGGISAVMNRIIDMIMDSPTVNGISSRQLAMKSTVKDSEVIRPVDNPYHKEGGIAVLKGNMANSSVIKQTAIAKEMMKHRGSARVFMSEQALLDAINKNKIQEGDVVVLPFQGPAGAPGMPEMLTPTDAIKGAGFKRVALLTDGRFSGATTGPCIGHIEPEAYNEGLIGIIQDGDIIELDIPNRMIHLKVDSKVIQERKENLKPPQRETTPLLERYREKYKKMDCYGRIITH
jgi:dihydroxy-acid dehydratase